MELLDLYDCRRQPTGQTIPRGQKPPRGLYCQVIHVCVFNSKGEMLIQQRQSTKDSWPNLWDVTVGGAVNAGETSQEGAHRELLEELGLDADFSNLAPALITTFTQGFDDIYVLNMELAPAQLRLQESEVQAAKWATKDEVFALLDSGRFIPYQKGFMDYIFFRADHSGDFDIREE